MENNQTNNPQLGKGFLRIASGKEENDLLTALIKARLNATEYQIVLLIVRKTLGWNKEKDWISFRQFENYTSKTAVSICNAINELVKKNIVVKDSIKGYRAYYQFNPRFSEWKTLIKKSKVVRRKGGTYKKNDNTPFKKTIYTKDTLTKNNNLSNDKFNPPTGGLVKNIVKQEKKKCPLGEKHTNCIDFLQELARLKNLPSGWLNFPKQLGFLHKLLRSAYSFEEIRKVAKELDDDKFMWDKWDLATIVSRIEKKGKEVVTYASSKRNY